MANWKFTDQYGAAYPALANSILSLLVFDVSGSSPVNPATGAFSAPLDLTATGAAMNVLATLLGMTTIPMSGTVSTANNTLTVSLASTNDSAITAAIAKCIPLIGGSITQNAGVTVANVTPASATAEDEPTKDEIDLSITILIGSATGTLVTQVPMSSGLFTVGATFQGFGVTLSDLGFLVAGGNFTPMFPTTLPDSYYNSGTALELLGLSLDLYVTTSPSLSVSVSAVLVTIGIVNIPLYPTALYMNPFALWISISSPTTAPTPAWGITGILQLYNYINHFGSSNPQVDFSYEIDVEMPGSSPTFSISGFFDNPYNQPVSVILQDFMQSGTFDTGIASNIVLEKLDFYTAADTQTGTISEFNVDIGMSSPLGLFAVPGFGVKDFSISVSYSS